MGNVRLTGLDTTIQALKALPFQMREKTLNKAVMAGAEVARDAIEALPWETKEREKKKREFGPIKSNIIIYKRKREFTEKGDSVFMLAGPSKKAFYAYFIEKGWRAPLGPRMSYTITRNDKWHYAGHTYTTRRLRRLTGGAAHSQMGLSAWRVIPGRHLVKDLMTSVGPAIYQAVVDVLKKAVGR